MPAALTTNESGIKRTLHVDQIQPMLLADQRGMIFIKEPASPQRRTQAMA